MSATSGSPLLGAPPPIRSTSNHTRFAFASRPHLQDEACESGGGGSGGGGGGVSAHGAGAALSPPPSNLHNLRPEQNTGKVHRARAGAGGEGDQNRQSYKFWEPKIDVQGGARFFELAPSELARSKAKLVLARLCFFLVAMTLYTFSDALDNIALTILQQSNASATEVKVFENLEPFLLSGMCIGCLVAGIAYDAVRPALVPLVGTLLVSTGAFLNALNVLWILVPNMVWWPQTVRFVSGAGIGCLYVASALLTANCGLHRPLAKELAITVFAYGAGAVSAIVLRLIFQQILCLQPQNCQLADIELLWVLDTAVLIVPIVAILFFVGKAWEDPSIRDQFHRQYRLALQQHQQQLQQGRPSTPKRTNVALYADKSHLRPTSHSGASQFSFSSTHSLPPAVLPLCTMPSCHTLTTGLGAGLTWFMVDAFFYGGSMYEAVSQSKVDLDPAFANHSNPTGGGGQTPFASFAASNLEQALVAFLALLGFVLAIPLLRCINRWYLQLITFLVLALIFGALAMVMILLESPLENCTSIHPMRVQSILAHAVSSELSKNFSTPLPDPLFDVGAPTRNQDRSGEMEASQIDIAAFCLIVAGLIVLNMGPNVTTMIIAVDTAPTRIHQGAYFGCVACLGKLGAVVGWFAFQQIQAAVDNEHGGSDGKSDVHDSNCAFGWSTTASVGAVLIAAVCSIPMRRSTRCHVTRMVTSALNTSNLNYGAIQDNILRHRAASATKRTDGPNVGREGDFRRQHLSPTAASSQRFSSTYGTQSAHDSVASAAPAEFMIPFRRITVRERFASGGSGQLYHGELDGEPVALKELFQTLLTGSTTDILFEANMLMRLQHPNMVRFFGLTQGFARAKPQSKNGERRRSEGQEAIETVADYESLETRDTPSLGADQFESLNDIEFDAGGEERDSGLEDDDEYDDDSPPPPLFIVTEFCSGGNVSQLVRQNAGRLHLAHMIKYCLDMAKVLQFLHQRPRPIVHLDVKPENLLLEFAHPAFIDSTSGGVGDGKSIVGLPKLKLCDLGVSKIQSTGVSNVVVGTLMYTPPEMLQQANTQIDGTKADVYSAALTFYVMLTGLIPYSVRGLNDAQIVAGLLESQIRPLLPDTFPRILGALLRSMWRQTPASRLSLGSASVHLRSALKSELARPGFPRLCAFDGADRLNGKKNDGLSTKAVGPRPQSTRSMLNSASPRRRVPSDSSQRVTPVRYGAADNTVNTTAKHNVHKTERSTLSWAFPTPEQHCEELEESGGGSSHASPNLPPVPPRLQTPSPSMANASDRDTR